MASTVILMSYFVSFVSQFSSSLSTFWQESHRDMNTTAVVCRHGNSEPF